MSLYNESVYRRRGIIKKKIVWHLRRKLIINGEHYYISTVQVHPLKFNEIPEYDTIILPLHYSNSNKEKESFELLVIKEEKVISIKKYKYRTQAQREYLKLLNKLKKGEVDLE